MNHWKMSGTQGNKKGKHFSHASIILIEFKRYNLSETHSKCVKHPLCKPQPIWQSRNLRVFTTLIDLSVNKVVHASLAFLRKENNKRS